MAIECKDELLVLRGTVTVEEAQPLHEWLLAHPGRICVQEVTHLHAAALQVLMVARPVLVSPFREEFLQTWLTPLFAPSVAWAEDTPGDTEAEKY